MAWSIAVLIPSYNEESTIGEVVRRFRYQPQWADGAETHVRWEHLHKFFTQFRDKDGGWRRRWFRKAGEVGSKLAFAKRDSSEVLSGNTENTDCTGKSQR